ncbi:hypothetical protein LIT38_12965 [Bacillus sp. CMF12]|uniref:hypothetical protein n=1 Tax=Bacillaceae TaxID=186817 RepID=UPI001FB2FDDC|nr:MULTISPECIES: hypothetical protein [Bacillaceae]UOE53089.1 hypothetical protein IRB79_14260 [Cytobacillus oceanisediminis]USK52297.1 hypothetical protein LIT38_12965 [Bacillus sp. CMF12]
MIFCTIAQPEQLAPALILAKSIKKHHPNAIMALCLTSKNVPDAAKNSPYIDHIISGKDLGKGFYKELKKKFSAADHSRALKAPFLNYLFNSFPNEDIYIYLDCFTKVFGTFNELFTILDEHCIIYSPYCLQPPSEDHVLNEFDLLKNGNVNGGFLAFRRSEESTKFLKRFLHLIKNDVKQNERKSIKGLFIDEKWLCLMIGLFDIYFFKDPSYHLAVWNLHEKQRKIEKTDEPGWRINGQRIKSMCFADVQGSLDWSHSEKAINLIQERYKKQLKSVKDKTL